MAEVRWTKLARDLRAERGRIALMVAAIAASLVGVGSVLGAYAILTRDIAANYAGTRPADVTLELPGGVDRALLDEVRSQPDVANAEAREVLVARARVGAEWRRVLLFVIDDFGDLRLNRFTPERGPWPPPLGTVVLERSGLGLLGTGAVKEVQLLVPGGRVRSVPVSTVVHDPGLAPAWQERTAYVYVARDTLAALGGSPRLEELRVLFSGVGSTQEVETRAASLASWLAAHGHPVKELRVPPLGMHPHQRQMVTLLWMMLSFTALALVLSAVLVGNALAALLARQVRELAVMKTLGATASQVAGLYAALVGGIGGAAVLIALPASFLGTGFLSRLVARLLNFELTGQPLPAWVFLVIAGAGVLVPLLVASLPITQASRRTIREAISDHGTSLPAPSSALRALPLPLRSALRRPARLALTLGLLSAGGAMAITAVQVLLGWEANVAKVYATRSYDTEVLFTGPVDAAVVERLRALPEVTLAEGWRAAPGAFARPGAVDVSRTYPDRGHGAFVIRGPPPDTALVHFPLLAGRWLEPADRKTNAVVLNHAALAQRPGLQVGQEVLLSLDGRVSAWQLVGIVEEIGSAGVAYVADEAFDRATGEAGKIGLVRLATSKPSLQAIEAALLEGGAGVESVEPLSELRTAMSDHILVLIRMLMAIAAILGTVGVLGLVSAMSVSVIERTRELAIMKTLGAPPERLARMLLSEALSIAASSFVLAAVLSLPLTLVVGRVVGMLGFLAPLPLVFSMEALAGWIAIGVVATVLATLWPARTAARLVIREALNRA